MSALGQKRTSDDYPITDTGSWRPRSRRLMCYVAWALCTWPKIRKQKRNWRRRAWRWS